MPKMEISGRLAACSCALALTGAGLTACGGSSGSHNGSPAARAASSLTTSTARATKTSAPLSRSQAERLRKLRSKATAGRATTTRPTVAPTVQQTAFRHALSHFAECLRGYGVKIPAPTGTGPVLNTKGVNTSSPQYRTAVQKCRGTLIAAFRQAAASAKSARRG